MSFKQLDRKFSCQIAVYCTLIFVRQHGVTEHVVVDEYTYLLGGVHVVDLLLGVNDVAPV